MCDDLMGRSSPSDMILAHVIMFRHIRRAMNSLRVWMSICTGCCHLFCSISVLACFRFGHVAVPP
jgi:hypothetical protein